MTYGTFSLVPRPSPAPVFDCLQYTKTEGEDLVNNVKNWRWRRPGNEAMAQVGYITDTPWLLGIYQSKTTPSGSGLVFQSLQPWYNHYINTSLHIHHNSPTAEHMEQGDSPEIAEPRRCQQVWVEYPTDNSTQKFAPSVCSGVAYS